MMMKPRRLLVLTLTILLLVQVALPVALFLARDQLMFLPRNSVAAESGLGSFDATLDAVVVKIVRPDGRRLSAYDACPAGRRAAGGPVVLFLHGNGGDIAMRAPRLARLVRATGLRWVMPDYSGYGGNPGSPAEAEVCRDGLAAFDGRAAWPRSASCCSVRASAAPWPSPSPRSEVRPGSYCNRPSRRSRRWLASCTPGCRSSPS